MYKLNHSNTLSVQLKATLKLNRSSTRKPLSEIHLTTIITAPVERVFDLSRSMDLHKISTSHTNEEAVAGIITGLINLDENVTWQARHLFKLRRFTSKITIMEKPAHFTDEMISGDFKKFKHEHHFETVENRTLMVDLIEFKSPFGLLGNLINKLFLKNYLQKLLLTRNAVIKDFAETQKWKMILK